MASRLDSRSKSLLGGITRSGGYDFCGGRDFDFDEDQAIANLPAVWANRTVGSQVPIKMISVGGPQGEIGLIRLALSKSVYAIQAKSKPAAPDAPWHTRSIPIHDLNSERYELRAPLQAEIEIYAEEVIAKFPELNLWASSSTESGAILKLKKAVCDLAEELEEFEYNDLGRQVSMWKRILTKLLIKSVST